MLSAHSLRTSLCSAFAILLTIISALHSQERNRTPQPADKKPSLKIPSGSRTSSEFRKEQLVFYEKFIDLYHKNTSDAKNIQDNAAEFLRASFARFTNQRAAEYPSTVTWKEVLALGKKVIETDGSADPLVRTQYAQALARGGNPDAARKQSAAALAAFTKSSYPKGVRWLLTINELNIKHTYGFRPSIQKAKKQLLDAVPDGLLLVMELDENGERIAYDLWKHSINLSSGLLTGFDPHWTAAMIQRYESLENKNPWLREMLLGNHHRMAGWYYRSTPVSYRRGKNGFAESREHLTKAATYFAAAHKMRPQHPDAAAEMVEVAMMDHSRESTETWFNRAIAAECDCQPAYQNMLQSLLPSRGGSHREMLEFGERCARTNRYDTGIPYTYVQVVLAIRAKIGWAFLSENPKIYDRAAFVSKKTIGHPSQQTRDGRLSQQQIRHYGNWLALTLYTQHFKAGRDLYEKIEKDIDAKTVKDLGIDLEYDISRMYAYLQFPKELKIARPLTKGYVTEVAKIKKIMAIYGGLRKRNKDPRAKLYLKVWDERMQMNLDYHDGKWVDLKFDPGLHQWRGRSYLVNRDIWTVEDENTILASNIGHPADILLYHRGDFPGPKEVMVEVEIVRKVSHVSRVGCLLGGIWGRRDGRLFWVNQKDGTRGIVRMPENGMNIHQKMKSPVKIRVRAWGPERFDFYVEGRNYPINSGDKGFTMATPKVGIATGYWWGVTGSFRFRNMRVRKLSQDAPDDTGDRAKAIAYYDQAIREAPEVHDFYASRGYLYFFSENFQKAIPDPEHALKQMPEQHWYRMFLGASYIKMKNYKRGFRQLEMAHKLVNKQEWLPRYMLAKFLAIVPDEKFRDAERSLEISKSVVKLTGGKNAACVVGQATALAALGRFDEALALLDKVEQGTPNQNIQDAIAHLRPLFKKKQPDVLSHDE